MAKPLLLILTLTALVVAASAASVTIYNPATLPVSVVTLSAGDHPRDGADYEDDVVKVSTTMTTVNLTEPEQDIRIQSTGDGYEVEVHVQDGDVLVVIPGTGELGFNIDILVHQQPSRSDNYKHVVPPSPK